MGRVIAIDIDAIVMVLCEAIDSCCDHFLLGRDTEGVF